MCGVLRDELRRVSMQKRSGNKGWKNGEEPKSHLAPMSYPCVAMDSYIKAWLNIFPCLSKVYMTNPPKDSLSCLSFILQHQEQVRAQSMHIQVCLFGLLILAKGKSPIPYVVLSQPPVLQGFDEDNVFCLNLSLIHLSIHD